MPSVAQRFSLLWALLFLPTAVVPAEEWTNLRGTVTIEANLLGIWNGRALLRRSDGRQVAVKLEDLNADSRIRAQDLQEEIDQTLAERIKELDAIAAEAAAAAPPDLPSPKPAPPYEAPSDAADLLAALEHRRSQAVAGHLRVYYDSLPLSHQAQAEKLFKAALLKVNAAEYEQLRSTLHQLSDVVVTKQKWIFAHPHFERVAEGERETFIMVALAIREWATPENASMEALQSARLSESIAKFDEVAAPFINELLQANSLVASLLFPSYEVETAADGKILAKVVLPIVGTVQSVPMVQLEGRWTEGTTIEDAQAKLTAYEADLAALTDGSLRMSTEASAVLSSLSALLTKLDQVKTKNECHRMLDQAIPTIAGALNAWAGVKPQADVYGSSSYPSSNSYPDGASDGRVPPISPVPAP